MPRTGLLFRVAAAPSTPSSRLKHGFCFLQKHRCSLLAQTQAKLLACFLGYKKGSPLGEPCFAEDWTPLQGGSCAVHSIEPVPHGFCFLQKHRCSLLAQTQAKLLACFLGYKKGSPFGGALFCRRLDSNQHLIAKSRF